MKRKILNEVKGHTIYIETKNRYWVRVTKKSLIQLLDAIEPHDQNGFSVDKYEGLKYKSSKKEKVCRLTIFC